MASDSETDDMSQLWRDALEAYRKETKCELLGLDFADGVLECTTAEDVMNVLQENMEDLKAFRSEDSKWGKVRKVLERVVDVVIVLKSVAEEAATASVCFPSAQVDIYLIASQGVPGGSAVILGIGVLLTVSAGILQ